MNEKSAGENNYQKAPKPRPPGADEDGRNGNPPRARFHRPLSPAAMTVPSKNHPANSQNLQELKIRPQAFSEAVLVSAWPAAQPAPPPAPAPQRAPDAASPPPETQSAPFAPPASAPSVPDCAGQSSRQPAPGKACAPPR